MDIYGLKTIEFIMDYIYGPRTMEMRTGKYARPILISNCM